MSWIACVASVSVRFRSKQRGTRVKHREKNGVSKKRGGGGEEKKDTLENKLNDPKPLFCRKKSLTFQRRSKKMFLHWRANLADQNKQQPLTIDIRLTYHTVLSVWNKPLIETRQHCSTSRANQALCSLANAGFQNRGVCLQSFPSFPSPSPTFIFWLLFHFSRGQNRESRSSVFLCSETKRKRLLRRLWVGIFLKFLAKLFRAALISLGLFLMRVRAIWSVKSGSVGNTRLLPCEKNAACCTEYFLLQVDYALEGSTFWLRKLCDFCRLFHTERSRHAYWFSAVIVSGQHDWWFALWCKSIFFDRFWNVKFFIAAK